MKTLSLIPLIIMLTACSARVVPVTQEPCDIAKTFSVPQWYDQKAIYRMRHGGVLQLSGKTIPMTGFMVLDTQRHTARVALLTGLGLKLITMDVSKDSHHVISTSPMAQAIPHFAEECAFMIQRSFLTAFPNKTSKCSVVDGALTLTDATVQGTIRASMDMTTGLLQSKSDESDGQAWSVRYEGDVKLGEIAFPRTTTFTNKVRRYTIILQLNEVRS